MGCYPPLAKIVSRALGKCNGGACQVLRFHFLYIFSFASEFILLVGSSRPPTPRQ